MAARDPMTVVPTENGALYEALWRAQTGDEQAFRVIFAELQPRLVRFLAAREPRAADDLAADVWLAVTRGLAGFVGGWDDFRAWFFTVARCRVVDYRRAGSRRRSDAVDPATLEDRPSAYALDAEVLDHISGQGAAALIARLLTPEQAEVVLLRVLGDLDAEQVAAIMGRSTNWVRVTQHRAVRRLVGTRLEKLLVTS